MNNKKERAIAELTEMAKDCRTEKGWNKWYTDLSGVSERMNLRDLRDYVVPLNKLAARNRIVSLMKSNKCGGIREALNMAEGKYNTRGERMTKKEFGIGLDKVLKIYSPKMASDENFEAALRSKENFENYVASIEATHTRRMLTDPEYANGVLDDEAVERSEQRQYARHREQLEAGDF